MDKTKKAKAPVAVHCFLASRGSLAKREKQSDE